MLLPQTAAYKTLYNRLTAVSSMHSALQSYSGSNDTSKSKKYEAFTKQFADIQIMHRKNLIHVYQTH